MFDATGGLWATNDDDGGSLDSRLSFVAPIAGGYLVGLCVGVFQQLPGLDPVWRLMLVTGFLGALTTFSSFSIEVVNLLQQSRHAMALATAGAHLLGSLALTVLGLKTAALLPFRWA